METASSSSENSWISSSRSSQSTNAACASTAAWKTNLTRCVRSLCDLRQGKTSGFHAVYTKQKDLISVKGHTGTHAYAEEEVAAFAEHLNAYLEGDADVAHLLPINPSGLDLAKKVRDGLLLAKFINVAVKDTIDTRALNLRKGGKDISLFQVGRLT
jgi:hypothetical protein